MNKKVWIYGAIGAVGSLAIADFFTINSTFAQSDRSSHEIPRPEASAQIQIQSPSPGIGQMEQMMSRDIDQHFIVMMIRHHQGASVIAELALTRAEHPEIKQFAEVIIQDQNREIEQMRTWYQAWYGSEASDMMGNQGIMTMHSMMTGNLETLENADDFDKEFLRQMIPHHQMALLMAQMVVDTGNKPEIRELAQTIITTQTAEINQMQKWNREWY